ncbi:MULTISPECIES: PaaI family thioesterase [Halocynthiibacter]|uniref:PaaI family thioesterase n=1 Tax=Halocynthiibacter halioticoli TaxID=2986804 RepID=A0AAE3J1S0_9RHOB|nr:MULTISPECIES: PaaI family thioesterase [Halocynthiibacter]MCV6824993.1 PaaI family thioesterase [Halocynthiibacter halioticoli]MCW4057994.1 PaaI family thioesterase [Halocynthiibacter sp. SDUM655004]
MSQSPIKVSSTEDILSMSGLEYMQEMLAGNVSPPPISGVMNYRIVEVSEGNVAFRGTPLHNHRNPWGAVHGGWYGTILDTCMGCAVMTMLPKGSAYTTLEYKVNITRSIPLGMEVEARGTSQHAGRSTGISRGEIRGVEDGKLYATASTTCLVMTPSKS